MSSGYNLGVKIKPILPKTLLNNLTMFCLQLWNDKNRMVKIKTKHSEKVTFFIPDLFELLSEVVIEPGVQEWIVTG